MTTTETQASTDENSGEEVPGTPEVNQFRPSGIQKDDAADLVDALSDRLVGLLDLGLTLKHIHWNLVGPGFMAVHKFLDEQVDGVRAMADAVAERIATLGGIPNGLPGYITRQRDWDDYDIGRAVVAAHLGALDKVYDGVIGDHRSAVEAVGKTDPVTEDLLVGQLGELELYQWFVRAHIENTSGRLMSGDAETELDAAAAAATGDPLA